MTAVGPYEFSEGDVATTIGAGPVLFDLLTDGLPDAAVDVVTPYRSRAEHALFDVAPKDPEAALGLFWGEWRSAMAAVRSTGAFGPGAVGTVSGLFLGDGGVPKSPVGSFEVDHGGVVGDRQADRVHHGRPWQALCLWSSEVIDGFRADGHPLRPGLAGENVTLSGITWNRMRPGVHLRIGEVLAEVSSYAVPCKKNATWFVGGHFDLMHHRHGPVSRIYATVLEPGSIAVGDPVLLEPPV